MVVVNVAQGVLENEPSGENAIVRVARNNNNNNRTAFLPPVTEPKFVIISFLVPKRCEYM